MTEKKEKKLTAQMLALELVILLVPVPLLLFMNFGIIPGAAALLFGVASFAYGWRIRREIHEGLPPMP